MGARRDSVSPGRFLSLEIPLPQLEEQRRIVAKLDAVSEKINEARARRAEADEGRHRVLIAMAHRGDLSTGAKASLGWRRVRLEEVVTQVTDERAVDTGATYPNLGIYSYARGLFAKPPIEGLATSAAKLNRVRTGQFIYSRLFAFEGAYAIVEPEFNGCFVSNEYPTFECDRSSATPEFLAAYFRAPAVWAQVAAGSKGLGDRRQRVQPGQLLSHELYLPPLAWQERIGGVMAELRSLGEVTRKTGEELDGLMPAILDRAFRGEL
jgi:type I restriction enzyme S subunit